MKTEEYAAAVAKLVDLAQQGTGGGRVAAQVVLSAYNGFDFQLDITDLGNLDRSNFEAAMTVIRGRYELSMEPQNVIANGEKIFARLWDRYSRLNVKNRGKVDCRRCDGRGALFADEDDETGTPCKVCDGTGRVCECKA